MSFYKNLRSKYWGESVFYALSQELALGREPSLEEIKDWLVVNNPTLTNDTKALHSFAKDLVLLSIDDDEFEEGWSILEYVLHTQF